MTVGPHAGRELELLLTRAKPLAMFVDSIPPEFESFPERLFDSIVAERETVEECFY